MLRLNNNDFVGPTNLVARLSTTCSIIHAAGQARQLGADSTSTHYCGAFGTNFCVFTITPDFLSASCFRLALRWLRRNFGSICTGRKAPVIRTLCVCVVCG